MSCTFFPDLEEATFTGVARIEVEVLAATDVVVLNANELEIGDASLSAGWASTDGSHAGEATRPLSIEPDPEHEMVVLRPGATLSPGRYTVSCRFLGRAERQALRSSIAARTPTRAA